VALLWADSLAGNEAVNVRSALWQISMMYRRGTCRLAGYGSLTGSGPAQAPPEAPPVVLLHALGEQSSDWAPVAAALAPSWRLYAPDLRGHGASDWPGSYTIEQLTTDLEAFLDALGLEEVTLVGHSIGAPPAYLYAARHPDRVTRLVLEDPAPPWPRARRVAARPEGQGRAVMSTRASSPRWPP
jgi:pimeloyl-ACP methyl ester carboxylesterase